MNKLRLFEILTSEAEVEVEADIKTKIRKMSELWILEILTSEAEAEVEADMKTEARYR